MPVRLDQIPALSPRPARPRGWFWLVAPLVLLVLVGVYGSFLFDAQLSREQALNFWALALGAPLLGWGVLSFGRVLLYLGQQQALDWVPLDAQSIAYTWRSGIDVQREEALSRVLAGMSLPAQRNQGYCDVDALLGRAGKASPWLAITAATQTIQGGAGPHFIISGSGCVDAALWSTVLTPVPSLSM